MKTSYITKLISIMLLLALCFYFGLQVYRYLTSAQRTVTTYPYTADDSISVSGYVVRNEHRIDCEDTLLELHYAEGERVALNATLATVYHSQETLERSQELERLNEQLKQLEYAKSASNDTGAVQLLDEDIKSDILSLHRSLSTNSFSAVNEFASDIKTSVLRYAFSHNGAGDLDERIASLNREIRSLSSSVSDASKRITAPFSGIYSAVLDGYEEVLTPEILSTLTPSQIASVKPDKHTSTVGKMIAGNTWYFVTTVTEEQAKSLSVGQKISLRFAEGVSSDLPMKIQSIGAPEKGKCAVVTYSEQYLAAVTLIRETQAELILKTYSGLRVPKNALRMNDGKAGVYCRIGLVAYYKPVHILFQNDDYIIVEPGEIESDAKSRIELYTIRAGDAVIISSEELYDGKVLE